MVCRAPAVALTPRSDQRLSGSGTTAVYTQTVTNYAMTEQSFDLSASGSSWPTTFWSNDAQITNTGPLADRETFTYTVRVTVPPGANAGDADEVTITALAHPGEPATASPTISDTASLRTSVLPRQWAQAFRHYWAPDGSPDPEQYLALVPASGIVAARVTDDGAYQYSPPAVAAYPRDAVVTAWTTEYRWNGSAAHYDVEYVTFDGDGDPVLPVTLVSNNVSTTVDTYDYNPAPAVDPTNGNVLFAWYQYAAPVWSYDVHYAVHDPAGGELHSPTALTINTTSAVQDLNPSVAAFGGGGFAMVWEHNDNYVYDIHYAVVGGSGELITGPVPLTSNTWEDDYQPRANRLTDGNVLLTWQGYHDSSYNIYYAVLDRAGEVVQPVTQLTDAPSTAQQADAVALRSGETVIAWRQYGRYPEWGYQVGYAVLDDMYVTATLPITTPAIMTNTLSNDNKYVSVARDGEDNAVLTWVDGNCDRIYYALVDAGAVVRAGPLVLLRTRGQGLDVGGWGANSGALPRTRVFLPLVLRGLEPGG